MLHFSIEKLSLLMIDLHKSCKPLKDIKKILFQKYMKTVEIIAGNDMRFIIIKYMKLIPQLNCVAMCMMSRY